MSDKYFLDTNIFVYSFDVKNKKKADIAKRLIHQSLKTRQGMISTQVIQEFLNVALGKFKTQLQPHDCKTYLNEVLLPLCEVYPDPELYQLGLDIHMTTRFSFYDSLIVSGALQGQCDTLYSEDLQDGQKIRDVTIKNPFKL